MKKTHMTLLTAAMLSLSSFAVADCAPSCETDTCIAPVTANAHRVYAGPEFMWSHFHGDLENDSFDFRLKQNVYYGGLRFGYEFLQPEAFYANTDLVALEGTTHSTARYEKEGITVKGRHLWTNVEQRLGYTFASSLVPSATVSAYVAPGFHYERVCGKHANWWYAATGLKTLQQFTDSFQLGLDLKVMYAFDAHDKEKVALPTTLGKKQFFGYEVGVPLAWTLGSCKTFDIQLKPYLLKLNVNSQETILGARAEFGFKF